MTLADRRNSKQCAHDFIEAARRHLAARGLTISEPTYGSDVTSPDLVPSFSIPAQPVEGRPASLTCYRTGKVSIAGPAESADALCGPLAEAGLLVGWQPGSRGAGVSWRAPVPDEAPAEHPLKAAVERLAEELEAEPSAAIERWLEQLARAGQRSAGGDLLCLALAAYAGLGGWHGAYRALAADLRAAGFRVEAGVGEAARLLALDAPPAGGLSYARGLGTIAVTPETRLAISNLDIDHVLDVGALYWLRRALAPVRPAPAAAETEAPWEG